MSASIALTVFLSVSISPVRPEMASPVVVYTIRSSEDSRTNRSASCCISWYRTWSISTVWRERRGVREAGMPFVCEGGDSKDRDDKG